MQVDDIATALNAGAKYKAETPIGDLFLKAVKYSSEIADMLGKDRPIFGSNIPFAKMKPFAAENYL